MANEKYQRTVNIQITVIMYRERAYTDDEIVDTLKIKSAYKEIKVIGAAAIDDTTEIRQ